MDCILEDQGVVQRSAIVRTISSCNGGETLTCRRIRGECNDTCSHIDATSFYILDIFDQSSALLQSAKTPYNIGGWCQDGMTMIFRIFPNVLQVAEQRDARERRSVATLEDFALSCSMQLHNSAFEALVDEIFIMSLSSRQENSRGCNWLPAAADPNHMGKVEV